MMKVSTIFLLFFLLQSFLLQDVFSQESSDKNENCTFGITIHPDVPRVPRVGCTAQSCLRCDDTAKAECFHNTTSNTVTCTADTSECSVQVCEPCQYCVGTFSSPTFSNPATSHNFTLHSVCFDLEQQGTCQELGTSEQCVITRTVRSSNDIFAESLRSNVIRSGDSILFNCRCYGENCTERLLYTYSILPTPSLIIVPKSPVTMETVSVLVTPTPNVMIPTPTNQATVSTPTVTTEGPTTISVYITAGSSAIGAVLAIIIIFIAILCTIKLKKRFNTRAKQTGPERHTNSRPSSETILPWQLNERIGQGRFGFVYKAVYDGQIVAVKIFSYNSRHSWENECNMYAMESTTHPNILEFITSESQGSGYNRQLFTVTKYYPFGSLNQYLRIHTVSWEQACTMIRSVACGLAHLHSEYYTNNGGVCAEKYAVAHRDMKSANILVRNEGGECVVSDLGLALILDPSVDAKQLANTGQVGTFRYMAPEALDARVNLHDLQSFKQIDVYAFALVIWEVIWRCALQEEDVPSYQLPFENLVGERPTLDVMRETVAANKLRPPLSPSWRNHEGLSTVVETIQECWDEDPEARLSAANVLMRMEDLMTTNLSPNEANSCPQTDTNAPPPSLPGEIFSRPPENSDSRPPPYSAINRDIPLGPISVTYQRRPHFQTSMPHILTGEAEGRGGDFQQRHPQRGIRSLRNSAILEGEGVPRFRETHPLSVRNSLVLGVPNPLLLNQQNSVFLSNIPSGHHDEEEDSLLDQGDTVFSSSGVTSEASNINTDSGFQTLQAERSSSAPSLGSADTSLQFNPSTEALTDFKKQLQESTDTLEADTINAPAINGHSCPASNGSQVRPQFDPSTKASPKPFKETQV